MSKFLKFTASVTAVVGLTAGVAFADGHKLGLGRAATTDEVAAWDIDVRPDGLGLPEGSGNAYDGEEVFAEKCAVCHGDFGEAVGRWPILAGGHSTLDSEDPVKTIGSYWPYLSTVFDYINRAMPFGYAQSLTPDEVYAITAYLLYVNDLVDEEFELSHENFAEFRLPNEDNFFMDDRAETEYPVFTGEVCMENCKPSVEITAKAAVVDVTPEDKAARERREAARAAASGDAAEASEEAAPEATEEPQAEAPAEEAGDAAEETAVAAVDPALVDAGEKAFKKCKSCHKVGDGAKNGSGPMLNGIVGRQAGTVEGFRYSSAMTDAGANGLIWTPEELAAFLAKPKVYLKGTKMSFSGFKKEDDAKAVIAYLSTFAD